MIVERFLLFVEEGEGVDHPVISFPKVDHLDVELARVVFFL